MKLSGLVYFQNRIIMFCLPISTFLHLWQCINRYKRHMNVEIELGTRPHSFIFGNICFEFSVQFTFTYSLSNFFHGTMYIKHHLSFTDRYQISPFVLLLRHSIDLSCVTGGDIPSIYNSPIIGLLNYCNQCLLSLFYGCLP